MESDWLKRSVAEQYSLVKAYKRTDETKVLRYRHKTINRDIILIEHKGNGEVYELLKRYAHKNIVRIYDCSVNGSMITVIEEYIDGITIGEVLQTGLYSEGGVKNVVGQLCDALDFSHSLGIIHRDIKPENIMLTSDGTVKLIDWSAARMYKKYISEDTKTMGTTGYAAPEQYGINQTDARADIYSVGILMNVMLTGEHPSKKMYSGSLAKVIKRCTDIQPEKRYQTAVLLKKQLI